MNGLQIGSLAEWFSGILTMIGTLTALYFSLRIPKPKITFDYVLHYVNGKMDYFKLTIINLSQVDTAIRLRGIDIKKDSEFGLHVDDEVDFKYMELKSGAVIEVDLTKTFRKFVGDIKNKNELYVCFDYSDKTRVIKKIKINDKPED